MSCCISTHLTFQVSQGSVATDLRWGENFNKFLFRNSFLNIVLKKLRKSVNICQSYQKNKSVLFFYGPQCSTIHGILSVQSTRLTVFFHDLFPSFLWSTSWSGTLHFILHTFLHPIIASFHNTCPYHCILFHRSTKIISSNPSLSLNPLLGILSCSFTPHIHLTILVFSRLSATSFSFLMGQVSLPCNILLHTQPLYNDISLLVSNGIICLNLFHPIRILFSTAESASLSTLNVSPK